MIDRLLGRLTLGLSGLFPGLDRSLQAKLTLPLLLGGIGLSLLGTWAIYTVAVLDLRSQLVDRGHLLGASIDQSFSLTAQEFEMRLAIEALVSQEYGVSSITLATADPLTIWASSFQPGMAPDGGTQGMLAVLESAMKNGQFGHEFQDDGDLTLIIPIGLSPAAPTEDIQNHKGFYDLPAGSYRGALFLEFDWLQIGKASQDILWATLAIFLTCVVVLVLLTLTIINRVVLAKVHDFSDVIRRYDGGDIAARVGSQARDEIGQMTQAFDEALDSLADSQELSNKVFRSSPALSAISRPKDGSHFDVNTRWSEVLGYSREEAMDKSAVELGVWANNDQRNEFVARLARDHTVRNFETTFATKDGRILDVLVSGEFMHIGGEERLLVVTTDITEQKMLERAQRQAQKMEAVGQLTGGVAHDFNNLLAVILGNSEILKDELPESEQGEIDSIVKAALRGGELTQRLLAFSRQQTLEPQVIDVGELVQGMLDMMTRTLGETIEIETSIAPDLWPGLADPGQLENVLLNLALNARDAMAGSGRLTISCANTHLDADYVARHSDATVGDYVVLQVSDEGSGMTDEVIAQAFEPFFTTKEVGKGSGLGLSMIYGFAKQSGGHVNIYSEVGKGTTICFYVPVSQSGEADLSRNCSSAAPAGQGETILVIEDDDEVRRLAEHILKSLGYQVIAVENAGPADEVLRSGKRVDLILSDVVLTGGVSGPEFADRVAQDHPGLNVIFMSGYPADAAKRNGFVGSDRVLLNKPFQRQHLAAAVRDALAKRAAE